MTRSTRYRQPLNRSVNAISRRPLGASLSGPHRQALASFLQTVAEAKFHRSVLAPRAAELAQGLGSAFEGEDDMAILLDEVQAWLRWYRLPGYWLAGVTEQLGHARPSRLHPWAAYLWATAQLAHGYEDLGVDSLERAFIQRLAIDASPAGVACPGPTAAEIGYRLEWAHRLLTSAAHPHHYQQANPAADNPYVQLTWLDFAGAFPNGSDDERRSPAELQAALQSSPGDEGVLARVVARRHLGYQAAMTGDYHSAIQLYSEALGEARGQGLDAEVGHLLRSLGHAQANAGGLDAALQTLSAAARHDEHPILAYWQGLDLRMLGTAWLRKYDTGDEAAMSRANSAYNNGRALLESHMRLSTFLPVSRVSLTQLLRSFTDNALQAADALIEGQGYDSHISDLLGEIEMTAPTGSLEAMDDAASMRSSAPSSAESVLSDRQVFLRWYRHGDESSSAYLRAHARSDWALATIV